MGSGAEFCQTWLQVAAWSDERRRSQGGVNASEIDASLVSGTPGTSPTGHALAPGTVPSGLKACRPGWIVWSAGLTSLGELVAQPVVELPNVVLTGHQYAAVTVDTGVHRGLASLAGVKVLLIHPVE